VGLAANANSREPTGGLIRHNRSVVTARFVWVALTDCREGKPGQGLSDRVVREPGRRRTSERDVVRRQMHKTRNFFLQQETGFPRNYRIF
jgi:hypothetical protein